MEIVIPMKRILFVSIDDFEDINLIFPPEKERYSGVSIECPFKESWKITIDR